jgi:allophanate hydrolase subunit 1
MSDVKSRLRQLEKAVNTDDDEVRITVVWSDEEARELEERCKREGIRLTTITIGGVEFDDI